MRRVLLWAMLSWAIVPGTAFSEDPPPLPWIAAPIIKDLPDIIIGDTGDVEGSGATAKRLYRYLNILNLFDPNVIVWRSGTVEWLGSYAKYHVWLNQPTASEPTIRASQPGNFVAMLSNAQYAALLAATVESPFDEPANTNVIDSETSFGFLSLMNTDIMVGTPSGADTATVSANGVETGSIPLGDLGDTEINIAAYEWDMPVTSGTLIGTGWFTVSTVMDADDETSGLVMVIRDDQFTSGSANGWYAHTDFGLADFGAATTAIGTTTGGIGWDATGPNGGSLEVNYGTWYLSNNSTNAQFLIPGAGMEDKVYRVRAILRSDTTSRVTTCSWRLLAISYLTVAWQGVQVLTLGNDGPQIDAPIAGDASGLECQIHFTPPYGLAEWADGEALDATNWVTEVPDANAPGDGRDYTLTFDGIDVTGNTGILIMDSCVIESYPRPADNATADLVWGYGGIPFDDAINGFFFPTTSAFPSLVTLGTGTRSADSITLTMGPMPGGAEVGRGKWNQASLNPGSVTAAVKYPETAGELLRYTITCYSPSSDIAPNVRYQTTSVDASGMVVDTTIWFDAFGPFNTRNVLTNDFTVTQPGAPRAAPGTTIDVYRYVMRTVSGRWLMFYWDAYGLPVANPSTAYSKGWRDQTGSITVTRIVLNGNLANP